MRCALAISLVATLSLAACGSSDADSIDISTSDVETSEVCDVAQDVADAFDTGANAQNNEEASRALDGFADELADFVAVAPSEIEFDAELLADGTRLLADTEPGEEPSEEALAAVIGADYDAAFEALGTYIRDTCGIDFG